MTQMLELSDQDFKISVTEMLKKLGKNGHNR